MKIFKELQKIERQKEILEETRQKFLKERLPEITSLLQKLDVASVDDSVLTGVLLFMKEKISQKDPLLDEWRKNGEKYFRKKRKKTLAPS